MNRLVNEKDLFYNSVAHSWADFIDNYDTFRRIDVVINTMLRPLFSPQKSILEVGIGLGYFTQVIQSVNKQSYLGVDIASNLVHSAQKKYPDLNFLNADLLELNKKLDTKKFDIVYCSEVLEHTPNPQLSLEVLCEVVAPGGFLVITVPNRKWIWLLWIANFLGIRKYQGYENWMWPSELERLFISNNIEIIQKKGIHFIPWHFLPRKWHKFLDEKIENYSYSFALNLAILGKKKEI